MIAQKFKTNKLRQMVEVVINKIYEGNY